MPWHMPVEIRGRKFRSMKPAWAIQWMQGQPLLHTRILSLEEKKASINLLRSMKTIGPIGIHWPSFFLKYLINAFNYVENSYSIFWS